MEELGLDFDEGLCPGWVVFEDHYAHDLLTVLAGLAWLRQLRLYPTLSRDIDQSFQTVRGRLSRAALRFSDYTAHGEEQVS